MEAADGVIGSDAVAGPGGTGVGLVLAEREAVTVGPGEDETLLAEAFVTLEVLAALSGEVLFPPAERMMWGKGK